MKFLLFLASVYLLIYFMANNEPFWSLGAGVLLGLALGGLDR